MIQGLGAAAGLSLGGSSWVTSDASETNNTQETAMAQQPEDGSEQPWRVRFCLNTSTIGGSQLPVEEQIAITAEAGYDGIELWVRDIRQYLDRGGKLPELRQRLIDSGLVVEGAIGFAAWIVDDAQRREAALQEAAADMDLVRQIGARRLAAPAAGATDTPKISLDAVADRYRALLDVGVARDVTPLLELWGFSTNLSQLADLLYIAASCGHPQSALLPDVYHMYKGGSDFSELHLLPGAAVPVLHMNDYPAEPDRSRIQDADRVFPGDGVAPLPAICRVLRRAGFQGALSLELFNRQYWQQDPREVARRGLESMRRLVDQVNQRA
jgi:2-keto-myo-inositol isomerase